MKTCNIAGLVLILVVATMAQSISAQEHEGTTRSSASEHRVGSYGVYYGDGLRYRAEGDYDLAVKSLFRAYGLRPSSHVMEMIIAAYDAAGHCDAALRQVEFFSRHHSDGAPLELQRCESTAEIVIVCGADEAQARLNQTRELRCGEVTQIPADEEHRIVSSSSKSQITVTVAAGERQRVELDRIDTPGVSESDEQTTARVPRLPLFAGQVARLPVYTRSDDDNFESSAAPDVTPGPDVPRLSAPSAIYRVYETSDGIYHVWVRSDDRGSSRGIPQVELICPREATTDDKMTECVWIRERE